MSVSDGQQANSTTFNNAFMSRTGNTSTTGVVSLENGSSGGTIANAQQKINDNAAAISSHTGSSTAHTAANLVNVPSGNLAATTVQSALDELQTDIDTRATSSSLSSHTGASSAVHGITGSVVGTTDTQSISNKTITASDHDGGTASNSSRITLPKNTKANLDGLTKKEASIAYATDTKKAYVHDGDNWVAVGSGSGSGLKNYISANSDAETGTTGWTIYRSTSGGAVPNTSTTTPSGLLEWTTDSSTPLSGTQSFAFKTYVGATTGDYVGYDFSIDRADLAKVLEISFDYMFTSLGQYSDGKFAVYIIADTTGTPSVIQPVGYSITKVTENTPTRFKATFQTLSSALNYRLLIYVTGSTSSSFVRMLVDSVRVGPQATVNATMVTDGQTYTTTLTNVSGTPNLRWKRIGDEFHFYGTISFTSNPTGVFYFSIPSSITPDTSKIADGNRAIGSAGGYFAGDVAGNLILDAGNKRISVMHHTGGYIWGNSGPYATTWNGGSLSVKGSFPVTGWGSSTVAASDAGDGRVVAFRANGTTQSIASQASEGSEVKLTAGWVAYIDTHAMWDAANSQVIIKVPGEYRLSASTSKATATSATFAMILKPYKNGVQLDSRFCRFDTPAASIADISLSGSQIFSFKAGDAIDLRVFQNSGGAISFDNTRLSIDRISGSSTIVAGETVAARYYTAAGQSIPNSSATTVVFGSKAYDTHGFYNASTGIGTIPVSGKYRVSALIEFTTNTNGIRAIDLNGSQFCGLGERAASSVYARIGGSTTIDFLVGQTFKFDAYQTAGVSVSLSTGGAFNYFSIERIGN